MNKVISVNLYNLIHALSVALDFTSRGMTEHHKRVAYISLQIGKAMDLAPDSLMDLYYASSLHDIGAITFGEKALLAEFEVDNSFTHCERGYLFLRDSGIFSPISHAILCHHDRWDGGNKSLYRGHEIPLLSRIIHLADRVDVSINPNLCILQQRKEITKKLKELTGRVFDPEVFRVFSDISTSESFWLDLISDYLDPCIYGLIGRKETVSVATETMLNIAKIFSKVIDSKSKFTYRHSSFVSSVAVKLYSLLGFGHDDQEMITIAALLHDLGKLSIPEEILEKPGRLTEEEYNKMKQHTYHTYHILNNIEGFGEIKEWAAYHHEKIDGTGYPFRIGGDQLSLGARVMAVSDIFAALVEDRPYRPGMKREMVQEIFINAIQNNAIDGDITALIFERYEEFEELKSLNNYDLPSAAHGRGKQNTSL